MTACCYFSKKFKLGYENEYEQYFLAYLLLTLSSNKICFCAISVERNISFVLNAHQA